MMLACKLLLVPLLVMSAVFSNSTIAATPLALSNPAPLSASLDPAYLGAIAGSASVSAGGNASYYIPIELPPGTNSVQPQLSLNYNSNMRNGMLGLGWFMQGANSAITRCPQNLAQDGQIRAVNYTAQDRFCLDGHKLLAVNGAYGGSGTEYRTEIDSFSSIESIGTAGTGPAHFEVRTKEGLTKSYGLSTDSRIEAQGFATVRVWALNRVEDASGNYYTITYFENAAEGEYYPTRIDYTANDNAGTAANLSVQFSYETRTDNMLHYEAGSKVRPHPKRLAHVKTYHNATLASDYRLTYEEIGVDSRSRLTQIDRCDGQGNFQEPVLLEWWHDGDVEFTASSMTVPYFSANSSTWNSAAAKLGRQNNTPRWHDLNGDGKPDYVHVIPNSNGSYGANSLNVDIELSGPNGYTSDTWTTSFGGHPADFYWADMDGDGRTDVFKEVYANGIYQLKIAFSTETSFSNQAWPIASNGGYYRDMNGDGLLDRIAIEYTDYYSNCGFMCFGWEYLNVNVQLNTGSGFGSLQLWLYHVPSFSVQPHHFADFDGDGLTDLIASDRYIHLNRGNGLAAARIDFGAQPAHPSWAVQAYTDYNGDGLTDRLTRKSDGTCCSLQLNTGKYFSSAGVTTRIPTLDADVNGLPDPFSRTLVGNGTNLSLFLSKDSSGTNYEETSWVYANERLGAFMQWLDINGDGLLDVTLANTEVCHTTTVYYNCGPYTCSYPSPDYCEIDTLKVLESQGAMAHMLKKVTTGLGVETHFTFKPLTDPDVYTKGSGAVLPEWDVQDSTHVVASLKQSDGVGGFSEIEYTYEALKRDFSGRGFLGFSRITAKNLAQQTTTITDYAQTFPYSSQAIHTEVRRSTDNQLLSSADMSYSVYGTVGSGPVFPYIDSRTTNTYELGDGRLLSSSTTTNQVDLYGNITDSIEEIDDHENGDTFKSQTLNTYAIDVYNWRIGQLTAQTIKRWLNGVNNTGLDQTTTHTYDPGTGLLSSSTRQPGGGAGIELTVTLARDAFGNITAETVSGPGISPRVSTVGYNSRGRFPVTMTNPLGHVTTMTWEGLFGQKASETDANGQATAWTYDGFGQTALETRPDGTTTVFSVHQYTGFDADIAFYSEIRASGAAPVREYYDLLGRKRRVETQGFTGAVTLQDTEYDDHGRVYRSSEPYFDGDGIDWNTNSYDFLGRVTAVAAADPVKSVTSSYDGFMVAITDNQNRTKIQTLNALGQVIEAIDEVGTTMAISYDAAGNRTQVTNAAGTPQHNSVTYTYDRLGRLLSQNDPDHGIYAYTYDALGQKLSEVSPKMAAAQPAQSLTYQYDLLGRITSRTEPEGTTTWSFDNTTGGNLGIGQLHSESSAGFSRTYSYGAGNYGRLTGTATTIGSNAFNTAMSYNSNGQLATETYPGSVGAPSGFQVAYTYNALGYQERVQAPGAGSPVYYQLLATDAAGRTTSEWMGDGSIATQAYEAASSRVTDQHTVNGATDIQHFSYTYDDAGNMTNRGDVRQGLSEAFTFDDLDRLTSGQVAGGTAATYAFDVVGNITEKSDAGNPFLYTSSAVHAVTEITVGGTTQNLSYDPNGNLSTGDAVPTITWSSYNKPIQLSKGGITYNFSYGPDRARYKKVKGGETTYYIGNGFERIEKINSTEYRHMIRANGKVVMLRKDFTAGVMNHQYVHRDHLGSVTALTKESDGSIIERYSYDAWGLRRDPTTWAAATITAYEPRGYTGHEHLDDIGIIHMNGRVYDPRLGRMLSPDPVTQAPENGQNYNRYTYAYNNPLKYTDPSGFEFTLPPGQENIDGFNWSLTFTFQTYGTSAPKRSAIDGVDPILGPWRYIKVNGFPHVRAYYSQDHLRPGTDAYFEHQAAQASEQIAQLGDATTDDGALVDNLLLIADTLDSAANALIAFDLWNSFISLGPDTAIVGGGLKAIVFGVKKAVNSNLQYAIERGVQRGIFGNAKQARNELKRLTKSIRKNGLPEGTIPDPAHADRVLVPIGNGGMAVYQIGKNGTAKLKNTLIAK